MRKVVLITVGSPYESPSLTRIASNRKTAARIVRALRKTWRQRLIGYDGKPFFTSQIWTREIGVEE